MATAIVTPFDQKLGLTKAIDAAYIAGVMSDTPAALVGSSLQSDTGTRTAAATAGAATLNKTSGIITSEALVTAAAATYTLTITNSTIAGTENVQVTIGNGTNSAGAPCLTTVNVSAGSIVIVIKNVHASAALNGTLTASFVAFE
jgi:hypothetical protein